MIDDGTYQLDSIVCTDQDDETVLDTSSGSVTVEIAQKVTCVFTNSVAFVAQPALSLLKQISESATGPWASSITVAGGADVYYQFTITNTGNVELSPVSVSDPTVDTSSCTFDDPLAVGADTTCVVGAITTETLAGTYPNTATASGAYEGTTYDSNESSADYIIAAAPSLTVEKSSATTELSAPGTVTYDYLVTNTGNVTITGLSLSDNNDNDDMVCAATTIAVGGSTTCTATHTFTQAELDAGGSLDNIVTASSNEAPDSDR